MAVADEIEALAARTKNDLDDLFDFGAHTQILWRHFRLWVQQGNTLRARNAETGSMISEQDLLQLYTRYQTQYVQALSFLQLITVFETFLFDFLRLLLTNEPRHLAQKKQIEVGFALSAADRGALVVLVDEIANTAKHRLSRSASA